MDSRASIEAWIVTEQLANVLAPVPIDVRRETWDVEDYAPFDAMISLNMIHIAPWAAAVALLAGAKRLLSPGGVLFLYGPFMRGGVPRHPTQPSTQTSRGGTSAGAFVT